MCGRQGHRTVLDYLHKTYPRGAGESDLPELRVALAEWYSGNLCDRKMYKSESHLLWDIS